MVGCGMVAETARQTRYGSRGCSQSPLWLGFSTTAASALFLVAGITGFKLDKHSRFVTGTAWTNGVIWWETVAFE